MCNIPTFLLVQVAEVQHPVQTGLIPLNLSQNCPSITVFSVRFCHFSSFWERRLITFTDLRHVPNKGRTPQQRPSSGCPRRCLLRRFLLLLGVSEGVFKKVSPLFWVSQKVSLRGFLLFLGVSEGVSKRVSPLFWVSQRVSLRRVLLSSGCPRRCL